VGRCGLDASGSGYEPVPVSCEHGNELWHSTKCAEFLDQLNEEELCSVELVLLQVIILSFLLLLLLLLVLQSNLSTGFL
jgi:hypothetical protein